MDIKYYFQKNKNNCNAKTYILHNYIFLLAKWLYLSDYTKKR